MVLIGCHVRCDGYKQNKMKRLHKIVAMAALSLVITGCAKESDSQSSSSVLSASNEQTSSSISPEDVTTLTGVAVGGAHASIEIEDEKGVEHYFEYPDLDRDNYDTWQEGDTMVVTYVHNDDPAIGDSVISLHQKNAANSDHNR